MTVVCSFWAKSIKTEDTVSAFSKIMLLEKILKTKEEKTWIRERIREDFMIITVGRYITLT